MSRATILNTETQFTPAKPSQAQAYVACRFAVGALSLAKPTSKEPANESATEACLTCNAMLRAARPIRLDAPNNR
jgi:hypothetical protein